MKRRQPELALDVPDRVNDEAVVVPEGETSYWLLLDDASVELMAQGILPEAVASRCHGMLSWKRELYRVDARQSA